jgi:DNA (cytosine-5)-methyltransferase 1
LIINLILRGDMNELALFAGAGGGILGGKLLGWTTVCAVEWEPYPASVLVARQNDGLLPPFPIWDDVQTFDGKPWRGIVDVVSGGFPCQDISAAGKGAGIDGERSGMWREMARIIHEVQPRFAFVENSPMLTSRGLGTVLGDLASMGFDARWGVLGAADVGANHKRERIWIVANSMRQGRKGGKVITSAGKSKSWCNEQFARLLQDSTKLAIPTNSGRGIHDGVAARVDRLKAIGNGQVPLCAATAWRILSG